MLSGCDFATEPQPLRQAEETGLQLQKLLNAQSLAAMRQIPADRILAIQAESQLGLKVEGVRIGGPITDGFVLPAPRAELTESPGFAGVPIIASYTSADIAIGAESLLKVRSAAQFRDAAAALYGKAAGEFLEKYPVKSDAEAAKVARRAATEATFEQRARQCARITTQTNFPAWIAEFSRIHPYLPGVRPADQDPATVGAYHSGDVPYWLGTQDAFNMLRPTRDWAGWDRELSKRMREALIAFAATGSPSTPSLPWPVWRADAERKIVLGDDIKAAPLPAARLAWHEKHPLNRQQAPTGAPRD
jgi:para-nitrobenzyl esterase